MTEAKFVNQNKKTWDQYKSMIDSTELFSPNELGQAYMCLSSDLAFAQSHYPDTQVCNYLNALCLQYQQVLYRRQPHRWGELVKFFTYDVPMSFYRSRKFLYFALFIFLIGEVVGVLSQVIDTDYFEFFFGPYYYNETLNNIQNGTPMAIYGGEEETAMYLQIAFNNVLVTLMFFVDGLLTPFFTVYKCIETGVMDGCFVVFFGQHGYLIDALVAPNEHGALELPACIISCAAGIQLGSGWFFPGKKTRMTALRDSARDSLMMVLAMIPVLLIAAFIESFVTRHQEWPLAVRLLFVVAGLAFIAFYVIYLPYKLSRKEVRE